ncbi:hypothetical protein Droror1_Dr00023756 [Drosera rotundifolia]
MGKLFAITLDGRVYSCKHCETHLSLAEDLKSRVRIPNSSSSSFFPFFWEAAHDKDQKYKEGKFILERFKVLGPDGGIYLPVVEGHDSGSEED